MTAVGWSTLRTALLNWTLKTTRQICATHSVNQGFPNDQGRMLKNHLKAGQPQQMVTEQSPLTLVTV